MLYSELNEKKLFGTGDFPAELLTVEDPEFTMFPHWHIEFEILRVEQGTLNLTIDERNYCLKEGDVAFVQCGSLHHATLESCKFSCIVFDLSMLCRRKSDAIYRFIEPIICRKVSLKEFFKKGENSLIDEVVDALFEVLKTKNQEREIGFYTHVFSLLNLFYKNNCVVKIKELRHQQQLSTIFDTINFIEEHYREPLSLSLLSNRADMNEKYFSRFFKNYTNMTPTEYINRLRIEKAAHELQKNDSNVTEAALNNGFNNISYFIKTFKKYKGVSPKKYSKANF